MCPEVLRLPIELAGRKPVEPFEALEDHAERRRAVLRNAALVLLRVLFFHHCVLSSSRIFSASCSNESLEELKNSCQRSFDQISIRFETPTTVTSRLIPAKSLRYAGTRILPCPSQTTSAAPEK